MNGTPLKIEFHPGCVQSAFQTAQGELQDCRFAKRLIERDPTLFKAEPAHQQVILNRLGWLESYRIMRELAPELQAFAREVAGAGLNQIVLLGMGGSSLCPEVLGKVFGLPAHLEGYIVLDSTAPSAVGQAARATEPHRTLFIIASKSGTTVETRSHTDFFFARQKDRTENPGSHFVAITDAGSILEQWGRQNCFRRIFLNPADIGGRFSAISYFGLIPAALLGIDLGAFLDGVEAAAKAEEADGPGRQLGAFLYACAAQGRDKITFLASPNTAPLVPWVEQLLAESTGKEGKGIFPIEGEPPGKADSYRDDRAFVVIRFASEKNADAPLIAKLKGKEFPVAEMVLDRPESLGAAFLHWEWATAAVGSLLQVNPFDEPNVKESKDNTTRLLVEFEERGKFARRPEVARAEAFVLRATGLTFPPNTDAQHILSAWLSGIHFGDYAALLAYSAPDEQVEQEMAEMRRALRDRLGVATLRGWGPRFLHSIGQLYKGGPARGHFLVMTHVPDDDMVIPGRQYTFGELITAQALGDADALAARSRPVVHAELSGDIHAAMRALSVELLKAVAGIGG